MVTPGYNWAMASAMSLKLPGKKYFPMVFPIPCLAGDPRTTRSQFSAGAALSA